MSIFNFNKLRKEKKEKNKPNFNPFGTALQTVLNFFGKTDRQEKQPTRVQNQISSYEQMEERNPSSAEVNLTREFYEQLAKIQNPQEKAYNKIKNQVLDQINLENTVSQELAQQAFLAFLDKNLYYRDDLEDFIGFPNIIKKFFIDMGGQKEILLALDGCTIDVRKYNYKKKEDRKYDHEYKQEMPSGFSEVKSATIQTKFIATKEKISLEVRAIYDGFRELYDMNQKSGKYELVKQEAKSGSVALPITIQEDSKTPASSGRKR